MSKSPAHRSVRSYVLRQGRLTPAQERAIKQFWPVYGIDYRPELLDLDMTFDRPAPKILEIGSGAGETTIALAVKHRENDYLALEVHRPGIGRLLRQAAAQNLANVRVICHDAVEVLKHQIGDQVLEQIMIFFPDPWPKKRHHKRRLVQPEFMSLLSLKLADHGRIFLATDWQDLAEHLLHTCDEVPGLLNLAGRGHFSPRPGWRPLTKFEQRGKRLRHRVWDLVYAKK